MEKNYRSLCEVFAERAEYAQQYFGSSFDEYNNDDETISSDVPHNIFYEFIVGNRSDSEVMWVAEEEALYLSNGKILVKDGSEPYTCYEKSCRARINLRQDGFAYKSADHTVSHGSMYKKYVEMVCRHNMREECKLAGASKSVSDIYQTAIIRWNADSRCEGPFPLKFATIEKTLRNLRKEKYESSPKTCDEIRKKFEDPVILRDLGTSLHREHGKLYNHLYDGKDFSYCIFSSPKSIELILSNVEEHERFFLMDATFAITPMCNIFKQELIIHAQFGLKSFPLVVILMSKRNTDIYESALNYVNEHILPLKAGAIITDFEKAMRNGIRSVVPGVKLLSCWFHHCQALRRKVASNFNLFSLVRQNEKARSIYRKFQCLALLPATDIKPAFDVLAYEALTLFPEFESFITYYEKQWIKNETPANYSLFLEDTRTTGAAEAFNGKSGKSFKTHGNLFNFLAVYRKEELVKTNELEQDVSGLIQRDTRKKKYRDRSSTINHFSRLLLDKKISVNRFLTIMANMDNKIVFSEHECPRLELNEVDFETAEDLERFEKHLEAPGENPGENMSPNSEKRTTDSQRAPAITRKTRAKKIVPEKPMILTRSKARKAASQKSNESASTNLIQTRLGLQKVRSKRRKAEDEDEKNESDEEPVHPRALNRKKQRIESDLEDDEAASQESNEFASTNSIQSRLRSQRARNKRRRDVDENNESHEEPVHPRALNRKKQRIESDLEDDEDIQVVTAITNSKAEIFDLHKMFEKVSNGIIEIPAASKCVMSCGRNRATVLLPCKHQPTCNECFVLWKIYRIHMRERVICPLCEQEVVEHIAIIDK